MSQLIGLSEIQQRVNNFAAKIGAEPEQLPTYGTSRDFGHPHIEVDVQYHYVVVERGVERDRKSTSDLNELLYWVFESVTFSMASEFEMHHRLSGVDSRRQLFRKQIDLFGALSSDWMYRLRDEIRHTMRSFPFDD